LTLGRTALPRKAIWGGRATASPSTSMRPAGRQRRTARRRFTCERRAQRLVRHPGAALTLQARSLALAGGGRIARRRCECEHGEGADPALDLPCRRVHRVPHLNSTQPISPCAERSARHAVELTAKSNHKSIFTTNAEGGWLDPAGWNGVVTSLQNKGALSAQARAAGQADRRPQCGQPRRGRSGVLPAPDPDRHAGPGATGG